MLNFLLTILTSCYKILTERENKEAALENKIRTLRKAKGLTQQQLSKKLGLKSVSAVAMWELGDRTPRTLHLKKLASVLGTTVDDLLND